jgi:hypothetical protein
MCTPIDGATWEVDMRSASVSIKVFGVYVLVTGITLLLVPNLLLSVLGIAATSEIWVRVLGAVAVVIGYYYWACGSAQAKAFFRASVTGRFIFAALCFGLVVVIAAPWQLLIFGAVDALGALWTLVALRKEPAAG